MSEFDSRKDYYHTLGADQNTSARDLDRLYKRSAARLHPDRGGSEEEMKALNEAYSILKDERTRKEYNAQRLPPASPKASSVVSAPAAQDIGLYGHCLSALLFSYWEFDNYSLKGRGPRDNRIFSLDVVIIAPMLGLRCLKCARKAA